MTFFVAHFKNLRVRGQSSQTKRFGRHCTASHRPLHGFTLIELLVVVSIIALLVSILVPALSNAREQAKRIKCMAHLRGVGVAFDLYTQDNDGWLPPNVNEAKPFYQPILLGRMGFWEPQTQGWTGKETGPTMPEYLESPLDMYCFADIQVYNWIEQWLAVYGFKRVNEDTPPLQKDNYPWSYIGYCYAPSFCWSPRKINGRDDLATIAAVREGKGHGTLMIDLIWESSGTQHASDAGATHTDMWRNHRKLNDGPGGNRLLTDMSCSWQHYNDTLNSWGTHDPGGWGYW